MKQIKTVLGVIFLSLLTLLPNTAMAIDPDDTTVNVAKRETAAIKKTAAISEEAADKTFQESELTFANILQNPDDVLLNFEFAKAQVRRNDVLGAASTLERILLVNPNLDQVRLFRVVVLYRLDNLTEAKNEIEILNKRTMPPALRKELDRYKKEINKRQQRLHLGVRESLGWQSDSNRNAVPSSKQRLFADTRLDVAPADRSRQDESFLNITTVDAAYDLGFQAGHQLVGSFTYFLQNQKQLDSLDLQSFQYEMGATYKGKWFNVTPLFTASHLFLLSDNFLRTQGGTVLIDKTLFNNRLNLHSYNHLEYQDYLNVKAYQTAIERRGNEFTMINGATFALTPTMSITQDIGYVHKEAKSTYNGYDRIFLETSHNWLWPKGQFLINSFTPGFDRYLSDDYAIAARLRRDQTFRYRVTYGAPLSFFFMDKFLPEPVKDVTMTFTYEYYRDLSNITNYTYRNNKFQFLWTKRWEF